MATPSSTSSESLADRLQAEEVYEEFCELMFGLSTRYEDLLEQLEKWGISSSLGALSRFKNSHRGPWAMARARSEHEAFLKEHGADLGEAEARLVAMRLFNDAASPETSTKDMLKMRDQHLALAKLKQDAVKLEQSERRLALLEKQVGQANDAMEDNDLTDEEKVARWKQVFGR